MQVPQAPRCSVVPPGQMHEGKQGLAYFAGVSAATVGARRICLQLVKHAPGGRAKAHLHENHETAIYLLSGESDIWYGDDLQEHLVARAGDFLYIPAGVPHLTLNRSQTEACTAVIARTDPNEQEGIVLLPELDALVAS